MEEGRTFGNGKDLLESCIEKLKERQNGEIGGNVALYPTVVVMLGEGSRAYVRHIKDTLDDNWNNACHLQYVSIVKRGEDWECARLVKTGRRQEILWESVPGNPCTAVCGAIEKMLELDERIFKNKERIKMEFVMEAVEEEGKSYYDFFLQQKNGLYAEDLKTFYLMLDQRRERDQNAKSDNVLQYVLKKDNRNCGTLYLLSNYLSSGAILGPDRIWQNYRLAADIMLLGGSGSGNTMHLFSGIKTASYAVVTKPTDEIAAVSLQALMREMYWQEENRHSGELTASDIWERLKGQNDGFKFAKDIWRQKIQGRFPSPEQIKYLPFQSAKALKKMQNMGKDSNVQADQYTMGAWTLFMQKNYVETVDRFLENETERNDLREKIQKLLQEALSLFEIRRLDHQKAWIRQSLLNMPFLEAGSDRSEDVEKPRRSSKSDYSEVLYNRAKLVCRQRFYMGVKQILVEEFDQLLEQAEQYERLYKECEQEVRQAWVVTGNGDESIKTVYEKEVRDYVTQCCQMSESGEYKHRNSAFSKVLDADVRKENLLSHIGEVFSDLIQAKIFQYDFEKELVFRMDQMHAVGKEIIADLDLQNALEGSVRLKSLGNVVGAALVCFYLCKPSERLEKQLVQQDGMEYVFHLNRTDYIEKIGIYHITRPEGLHLEPLREEI